MPPEETGIALHSVTDMKQARPGVGEAILRSLAVFTAVLSGTAVSAQTAINGTLATETGSALAAAVISNTVGGLIFVTAALASARVRSGIRRLFRNPMRWWSYIGGVFGAVLVFAASVTAPLIGVALFSIGLVCGIAVGGLVNDTLGIGPLGRLRPGPMRLLGAGLAVAAVVLAQSGGGLLTGLWFLVVFAFAAGVGNSFQTSLNGRVNLVSRNVFSTGLVNFVVGTGLLYLVAAPFAATADWSRFDLPGRWWLYLGGPCGALVVVCVVFASTRLDVLGVSLANLAGQLGGAIVLDIGITGTLPSWQIASGSALAAAAAALVALAGRTRRSARLRDGEPALTAPAEHR